MFHSRGEVGCGRGRFGFGLLLELTDGAAVGFAAHGGEDLQAGVLRFEFFDGFLTGEAVVHHSTVAGRTCFCTACKSGASSCLSL